MVKSFNVTKTAEGDKGGLYTTVIAAAVFVIGTDTSDELAQLSTAMISP